MTSIVAAVGASALGVGLIGFGTGVGANFITTVTGTAHASVGSFGCLLSSADSNLVTIGNGGKTATVTFSPITSSAPSSETAALTVTNTGSTPVEVNSTIATNGNLFSSGHVQAVTLPQGTVLTTAGTSQNVTYQVGFQWSALDATDLNTSGTAAYTFTCTEPGANNLPNIAFFGQDGGTGSWNGTEVTLSTPTGAPASSVSAGFQLGDITSASAIPTTAPAFTTDTFNAGSPRMDIYLADSSNNPAGTVWGYPVQASPPSSWNVPGSGASVMWSDVLSYISNNGLHITHVTILMDGDQAPPATAHVTCVNYPGSSANFGTGC